MKIEMNQDELEFIKERFALSAERLESLEAGKELPEPYSDYFANTAEFIKTMVTVFQKLETAREEQKNLFTNQSVEQLLLENRALYADIIGDAYENSYTNPNTAVEKLGETFGKLLCFLATEMRSLIVLAYEGNWYLFTIRMELFLEIYHSFTSSYEELETEPDYDSIQQIIYWFVSDYSEVEVEHRILEQIDPAGDFAFEIIWNRDLSNPAYLFEYGEYITDNEIKTAQYLSSLDEETIHAMADTYTEGFHMGFVNGNKDLTKKKVVNIRYSLGFERVVKKAIENFAALGLKPTLYRAGYSIFNKTGVQKAGYFGANPNKQYDYDHKDDKALYFDKLYMNRRLEILKTTYEKHKEQAALFAGPAVIEIFGEEPFEPATCQFAYTLSEVQQKLSVEFAIKAGDITNQYIKGEERSFTIIAFPSPAIGENFEEIFHEVIKINTLDATLYGRIQNTIIETLDQAEFVEIKGMNHNHTELKVALYRLQNPAKETIFENCVADVNIPVGEVFTSPVLKGTNGVLHVSEVFLNELRYENLELTFTDGMITDYSCSNFKTEAENKKYIKDNILFHHDSLPLGEFAIGTNTTAYVVTQKFKMADKMPILIAEKMGPHFAVGDTCYSHSEDVKVYNPNGKEIVARDNEVSLLRKENTQKAYFNCHTDITIPYDELGELTAVKSDGSRMPIILEGRFVLEGCEELNKAFLR